MSFIFDGQLLEDFGYVEFFDGLRSENLTVSGMTYETIKSALSDISLRVNHTYDSDYSTTLMIMKNPCEDTEESWLTEDDIALLTRWLVRKSYKWFKYVGSDVWYKVQNTVEKIYEGDHVLGLAITVNANAPFGFTDEMEHSWESESSFNVKCISDEEGIIYPDVEIIIKEAGDLMMINNRGNNTVIKNLSIGEHVNITGGNILQITTNKVDHSICDDFNYKFPQLISEYNNYINKFTVNLDCDVTMKYRGVRKVGL